MSILDPVSSLARPRNPLGAMLLAAMLAGCTAGIEFQRPDAPDDTCWAAAIPQEPVATARPDADMPRFSANQIVGPAWWQVFANPALDAWIERTLATSPSLEEAEARVREAREIQAAQAGDNTRPRVDAGISSRRQRFHPEQMGLPGDPRAFNLHEVGVGLRYRLDLGGGNQRQLEALMARTGQREYAWESARQILAGSTVAAAIEHARLAAAWKAATMQAVVADEALALARARERLGQSTTSAVLAAATQAADAHAAVASLTHQRQLNTHLLATLAGQQPGAMTVPDFRLEDFILPAELPTSVPSELVRRRPDILAAEALLHAATAEYGVTAAGLYPRIDLNASLGTQALSGAALFDAHSAAWSLIAQLTQPLFDPGLPARKRAALAAIDASRTHYQSVVLEALRDTADAMHAASQDATVSAVRRKAMHDAETTLAIDTDRLRLGAADQSEVLVTKRRVSDASIALADATARQLTDIAKLHQSLAGSPGQQTAASADDVGIDTGALAHGPRVRWRTRSSSAACAP